LTNLHNPSGSFLSNSDIEAISNAVKEKNDKTMIIVDENYRDFVAGKPMAAATLADNIISFNSLTKVYGLGIIHLGWVIAQPDVIEKTNELQTIVEGSGSRFTEAFAALIIEHLDEYLERSHELVSKNRQILDEALKPLFANNILNGNIPENGCIYFPRVNIPIATDELTRILIEKYKTYVVPGKFFDQPQHIRIGFSSRSEVFEKDVKYFTDTMLSEFS
jgi:aspartate/methionine/tyrosine aminotransferase